MNLSDRIGISLGSENSYAVFTDKVDPSLLNPLPRRELREENKIDSGSFFGVDVWHCHEATFLLNSGMPIAGTLKIVIPSNTQFLPESKSLKLYLNTYDMCKMGETLSESIKNYEESIQTDLIGTLDHTGILVKFFTFGEYLNPNQPDLVSLSFREPYFKYKDLQREVLKIVPNYKIEDYSGGNWLVPYRLPEERNDEVEKFYYKTNVLRSRCRHTKQKDTGTAYIFLQTRPGKGITDVSLLKHLISFREVNEFHELCCEKLFQDIMDTGVIEKCCIHFLYARRGSLDINPVRSNVIGEEFKDLVIHDNLTFKQMSQ